MRVLIIMGLFLVVIGLVILLIDWPAWFIGVALIAIGLAKMLFFGWVSQKVFADRINRERRV